MSGPSELTQVYKALEFLTTLNSKEGKETAFLYMGSAMYIHHVREYVKKNPKNKAEIIEALELLLTELKTSK
jgi:flagellin-specific chaperone FliS